MDTVTREFSIVVSKQAALVAELERLAKRAKRIGAPEIAWTFGEVEQREVKVQIAGADPMILGDMAYRTRIVPFIKLTLSGVAPVIAGWAFAATLQHLDGVNILRSCSMGDEGPEIPDLYRTRGPVCDHCQQRRLRNDTYLVRSEAGEWKQIGSSCLKDFTGHDDPNTLATYAEILASAIDLCGGAEDDEDGGFGFCGRGGPYSLVEYLAHVAAEIRESGWVPRSRADERTMPTADCAEDRMAPHPKAIARDRSVTDTDRAIGLASYEWALHIESSGERMNDYLWNLFTVAKSGLVEHRTFGIAASIVASHTNAQERIRERAARKPSEYVGTAGKRQDFTLTLSKHVSWDSAWGWQNLYLFRDADDNFVTWKTGSGADLSEGETYHVKGTIKKHEEYKGTKQTILTRCVVRAIEPESAAAQ
jgi:hypothetical protein